MLKRWIEQFYKDGIYSDEDLETFVSSGDLTIDEVNQIKISKQEA